MNRKVVLSLQGQFIPVDAFLSAASDFLTILNEVDRAISGKRSIMWGVTGLRVGSAVLEASPRVLHSQEPDRSDKVIAAFVKGLKEIEKKAVRPPYFSDVALTKAKELSAINGLVSRVSVRATSRNRLSKPVLITQRIAANVDELIGPRHVSIGALEGRLEVLSIHGGTFGHVYDLLTGRKIKCFCDPEMLRKLAGELGRRVLVFGEIRSDASGRPLSVSVESYRVLRDREALPQTEDIKGVLSGISAEEEGDLGEYLRN